MENGLNRNNYLSFWEASIIAQEWEIQEVIGLALNENSEIPEDFSCNICMVLVYNPYSCNKCDQIFCKTCMIEWKKSGSQTCPCCN